jgi:hypothetical protein
VVATHDPPGRSRYVEPIEQHDQGGAHVGDHTRICASPYQRPQAERRIHRERYPSLRGRSRTPQSATREAQPVRTRHLPRTYPFMNRTTETERHPGIAPGLPNG